MQKIIILILLIITCLTTTFIYKKFDQKAPIEKPAMLSNDFIWIDYYDKPLVAPPSPRSLSIQNCLNIQKFIDAEISQLGNYHLFMVNATGFFSLTGPDSGCIIIINRLLPFPDNDKQVLENLSERVKKVFEYELGFIPNLNQ